MQELTSEQMAVMEQLHVRGFQFATFPMYERQIGIRKGNCAALLEPAGAPGVGETVGWMKLVGDASYLVAGNLSVRVMRGDKAWFVWKKNEVEATPEREKELAKFRENLDEVLSVQMGERNQERRRTGERPAVAISGDEMILALVSLVRAVDPRLLRQGTDEFTVDLEPLRKKAQLTEDEKLLLKLRSVMDSARGARVYAVELEAGEVRRLGETLGALEKLQQWPADVTNLNRRLREKLK